MINQEHHPGDSQRRNFFRDAVSRIIKPLADYIDRRVDFPLDVLRLRPPGAIAESALLESCIRCGACVEICPADAIFSLESNDKKLVGTPVIDPDKAACVVCEGLQCTHVCPSGALLPVEQPKDICMGMAEVYRPRCVRSDGEDCTICVDQCPIGDTALRFNDDGPPQVLEDCVGCGVCQLYCPTTPKAIIVHPL